MRSAPISKLYFYQRHSVPRHPGQKLDVAVAEAVNAFTKKFGYVPSELRVREDEVDKTMKFPIPVVVKVSKGLPQSHFLLSPVVEKRTPRIFTGKRTPCL